MALGASAYRCKIVPLFIFKRLDAELLFRRDFKERIYDVAFKLQLDVGGVMLL